MRNLRIVFMGTPEFAVASLKTLIENGYEIAGVITAPDKPKGRGQKLSPSPVKEYALSQNLTVLQPRNLKAPEFLEELRALHANLQVVVAFRMLPEAVWAMPEYGTFNLHASLLPNYRGAAPINWAIINGEKETGVTTFMIRKEIDTGAIIAIEKEPIHETDTAGSLHDRLMEKGAALVLKTVRMIEADEAVAKEQDPALSTHPAPKIAKETCRIDWNKPAVEVRNFIRGLSPYPGAWTIINDLAYKIYAAETDEESDHALSAGEFITDGKTYIKFKTKDRLLNITELQQQGKKKMDVETFLRGNAL